MKILPSCTKAACQDVWFEVAMKLVAVALVSAAW